MYTEAKIGSGICRKKGGCLRKPIGFRDILLCCKEKCAILLMNGYLANR